MRRIGDRRSSVRLEVVGALWGTLEIRKQARVVNMSDGGALLSYPVPVLPDTVHTVELEHGAHDIAVEVRVRHVRTTPEVAGQARRYLAGVEFLSIPDTLRRDLAEKSGNRQ